MTYGNPFKHAQEKVKPSSFNFNSFPFEKEFIVSFYKDTFNFIDSTDEVLKPNTSNQIG